jgi:hypothetical protein
MVLSLVAIFLHLYGEEVVALNPRRNLLDHNLMLGSL